MIRTTAIALLLSCCAADAAQIANPASVNCVKKGGALKMSATPAGEYGICVFTDNRQCEEWALFYGQCRDNGVKITGYDSEPERYCAIRGGRPDNGYCLFPEGKCPLDAYFGGSCRPDRPTAKNPLLDNFSGYWLALDYAQPALDSRELYGKPGGDLAFRIYEQSGDTLLRQFYNFHESCDIEIASAARKSGGYEALLSRTPKALRREPDGMKDYFFQTLETGDQGPELILRRTDENGFMRWRLFKRVIAVPDEDPEKVFSNYIGEQLLAGKYRSSKQVPVEFSGGGFGKWNGKPFSYTVILDYVLGPQCNLVKIDGDVPVKGIAAFEKNFAGEISFKALEDSDKTASGVVCTDKIFDSLVPEK